MGLIAGIACAEMNYIGAETFNLKESVLQNPHRVVGSGYIQFPPQVPFAQPIARQPPTITVSSTFTHTLEAELVSS